MKKENPKRDVKRTFFDPHEEHENKVLKKIEREVKDLERDQPKRKRKKK